MQFLDFKTQGFPLIRQMEIGPMENFVYFLGDPDSREVVVVDPAWEVDTIFKRAQEEDLKIVGALISHRHHDHTNGIGELLERVSVPIYIHKKDAEFTTFPRSTFTEMSHGDSITVGKAKIDFLHTPGHTAGSQCFRIQNHLITGDTLFINGCGRCDFPSGDVEEMYYTLTQKIMRLPEETVIHPGHNYAATPIATLGEQKKENPYLRLAASSLQGFMKLRK